MKFQLSSCLGACLIPYFALADVTLPFRSMESLLNAESVVFCSDYEEVNASRATQFLSEAELEIVPSNLVDGPSRLSRGSGFNALVVITGVETESATEECANESVPYKYGVSNEIAAAITNLIEGFEVTRPLHGNPTWAMSISYHESEDWVTVVIASREPSVNFTLTGLFGLPLDTCEKNSACAAP